MSEVPCDPDSIPDDLILSEAELQKLIYVVVCNVEVRRRTLRMYKKLMEELNVKYAPITSGTASLESFVAELIRKNLANVQTNKGEESQELEISEEDKKIVEEALRKAKELRKSKEEQGAQKI